MKLYTFQMSPNAKRARVVANEVGVSPEIVLVDPMKGEHMQPEFLAKNPNHKVPVIQLDDGTVLWESPAILVYFAEKYPEKRLLPADPLGRAEVARWMFWNASHLEAALFTIALETMFAKMMLGREANEVKVGDAQRDVERFAPVVNGHLEGREYLAGTYSIADISLATTVEFASQVKMLDLSKYTHLGAWLGRVQARDAWKKSSLGDAKSDSPPPDRAAAESAVTSYGQSASQLAL
jgi:glutathione S-transferase